MIDSFVSLAASVLPSQDMAGPGGLQLLDPISDYKIMVRVCLRVFNHVIV